MCEALGNSDASKGPAPTTDSGANKSHTTKGLTEINQGIRGAWFNPVTDGQGFLFDVEPVSKQIFVAWFTYEEASAKVGAVEHRWLIALGNYTGASAQLDVFVTSGGVFDDPQGVTTVQDGSLTINFSDCNHALLEYDLPSDGLQGQISITRVIPGTEVLCETLEAANE